MDVAEHCLMPVPSFVRSLFDIKFLLQSSIHGSGTFSKSNLAEGDVRVVLGIERGGKRVYYVEVYNNQLERYCNV